jgi:ethanolamine utilization protein EutN
VQLARVLGRLVGITKQDTLSGVPLQWIEPLTASGIATGNPLDAVDPVGTGPGEVVVFVASREAALTLENSFAAVDAGIVAKVDWRDVDGKRTPQDDTGERRPPA